MGESFPNDRRRATRAAAAKDPGALLREGDADEREEERPDAGVDVERCGGVLPGSGT
jgi:hypothetical protein